MATVSLIVGSVVQLQHRHLAKAVTRQMLGRPVAALAHADRDLGHFQALLGQENAHAARIGRRHGLAIELHGFVPD
jgi:hypothetical protein